MALKQQWQYRRVGMLLMMLTGLACGFVRPMLGAEPSNEEQYWLQLVNRFRADPAGELDRLLNYEQPGTGLTWSTPISDDPGVASALQFFQTDPAMLRSQFSALQPSPPLAWSENLHASAEYYSRLMIQRDEQSHQLDKYTTDPQYNLLDRFVQEGGYDFSRGGTGGENIYAFASNVFEAHAAFLIDWGFGPGGIQNPPGHRNSLLNSAFREIGISYLAEADSATSVGPYVATQHLGLSYSSGPFLTGAVYRDINDNAFYTAGEGLSGLELTLENVATNEVTDSATAYASGGYRLDISDITAGTYRLVVHADAPVYWSQPFSLQANGENVTLDVVDPQNDIDSISLALRTGTEWSMHDLNEDGRVDRDDRRFLVETVLGTYLGDSNLDGEFNSTDMVAVFRSAQYEDNLPGNSVWATGDWDGDGDFSSTDMVVAFQGGGYEVGPRLGATAVPEPTSTCPLLLLLMILCVISHRDIPEL